MKSCPNCGYIVPGSWTECRRCGSPIAFAGSAAPAPPPPPPPRQPSPALVASRPAPADDAFLPGRAGAHGHTNGHAIGRPPPGPDTWLPKLDPARFEPEPEPARPRFTPRTIAIAAFALVFVVAAGYVVTHRGKHDSGTPTILEPREPFAGIPTSLSDVVRIQAESTRHTALSIVISAAGTRGAALTTAELKSLQPGYQWVAGNQTSTTNTVISVASAPGSDTIAVSGTDKDICAFGRWSPTGGATYVTMAHAERCSANAAPADGWSPVPGGAAQDLPNELGG